VEREGREGKGTGDGVEGRGAEVSGVDHTSSISEPL